MAGTLAVGGRVGHSGLMCGRFNVIDSPGLQELLQDLGLDLSLPPGVNLAPTEGIHLIRHQDGSPALDMARWWLTPAWAKQVDQKYAMFNARSETLASSRAFRGPFRRQRGIVPMSSFIEWRMEEGRKQPWLISNESHALAVAALWDVWESDGSALLSCTLLTTAAAPAFEPWHKRMPVVLLADEQKAWMDNAREIGANSTIFRGELKMPLLLQPLSTAINNARNKDASLLEPIGEAVLLGS